MMIRVGGSKYINVNNVVVVIDYDSIAERNYINRAKEQGMLLNISKNKKFDLLLLQVLALCFYLI